MNKDEDDLRKKQKKTSEEISKSRKKLKKSKMVVAVSNEDDIDDFFTWEEYLEKCRTKAAPKSAFKHVQTNITKSGFKAGMKVEAKDRSSTCNSYWVATIVMVSGPLLLLRFDGYDNDRSGDFWLSASSPLLQPIGWCAKTDNLLMPPEAIRHKEQNWAKYLINNLKDAIAAPDELFHKNFDEEDKYIKIGAKLEVQDSEHPSCYWIASVVEVFGLRLRLRFEGYESEDSDIWEYLLSDHVHNLGWSKSMKITLKPPKVMEKYSHWSTFRRVVELCMSPSENDQSTDKQEVSLPINNGFKLGMKLEAVNPENPLSICAATVKDILNKHFFTVEIDSLFKPKEKPPKFVCHSKSKYIFPVGWCEKNNVKLTPPKGYSQDWFQWKSYLDLKTSKAAPESLFDENLVKHKPISLSDLNQIELGSYMEVLNEEDPTVYWVGKVMKSDGFKLYIHLEGDTNKERTIEVYYLSESVHHLGWGKRMGLELKPPKVMKPDWAEERKLLDGLYKLKTIDPLSPLKLKQEDFLPDTHGFKEGMQLEAVNPRDPSSICVASVKKNINEYYFMVQIDSLINATNDENIVFWCHAKSKNIFPVGWCDKNNLQLTPPPGYSNKEFNWETYMESVHREAAPESLFCQKVPSSAFDIGLKLEAVDQTKPETISVATVTQVVGRTIWVRLDGYPSNAIEYIYDMESYYLLPVGWCSTYGHPLLTPHQKKNEPQTRRWVASLRKRSSDSRVTTTADSSTKRQRKADRSAEQQSKLGENDEKTEHKKQMRSTSTERASLQTPSSSTADDNLRQTEEIIEVVEADTDTDTASETEERPTTTIDLTDDNDLRNESDKIRMFVKRSCSFGPYIDENKMVSLPNVIGPAEPNVILRKVVEHVVRSSYSPSKVLQLLSSEKEKKSFFSILKTLVTKLHICENLFSLHVVEKCASCDKGVVQEVEVSPGKSLSPALTKPSSTTTTPTHKPKQQQQQQQQSTKKTHPSHSFKSPTTKDNQSSNSAPFGDDDDDDDGDDDDDEVIGKIPEGHISTWSIAEVVEFVSPRDCKKFADVFIEQEVDGKALMLLSLDDIHKVLGVTLGPAIKLHDDVQKLRRRSR